MIQLIISTAVDVALIRDDENNGLPTFQCANISEVVDGWLILINEPDDWDYIEEAIEAIDDVHIVGSYNMDGTQYLYGNANRNHTITKYKNKLHPKRVYDENGDLVSEIPYTESEALNKQVNLIAGHNNRILT